MAGKLSGKKVLMIICPANFRDEELLEPKGVFESEGAAVTVASKQAGACRGMLGATAQAEIGWDAASADDYDAVVVVGGAGSPQYLWNDATVHGIVRKANSADKVIAAICLSGAVLANAGILKGIEATVYPTPDSKAALSRGGAKYVEKDVVVSGRIITGVGPQAAAAFGRAVAGAMA